MAVDRGELRYTLEVEGSGPERVREFRAELVKARQAWRAFKQDIRSLSAESKALAQGTKALAESTRAAATAQAKLSKSVESSATAQKQSAEASAKAAAETKKLSEAEKRVLTSKRERLALEKKLRREATVGGSRQLQALRASLAAQKEINKAYIDRLKYQRLSETNVRRQVATARALSERAKTLLQIDEARARAKDPIIAQAKAELLVEKQISREKEKQLVNDIRVQRGLAPLGQQAAPTTSQAAKEQFDRDLRNAQIKEQTDALKRNSAAWQKLAPQVEKTEKSLSSAGRTANRISFTFRRLFGILAAFAAARLLIRGFQNLIKQAVAFNAQLEIARLSIAALFVATSDVRDATGETVTSAQQLALAQTEAARQTQLLRLDALKTAATFEQLLDTFQIAIAPGTRAGLATDQIRQFTVRISQAATALGVAQNQLAEEIRSILAGTIQLRTTRIAAALGITNEDIRRAKEAGRLFEFLTDQFEAFGVAGEEALSTFAGLTGRVSDAMKQLFGAGTFQAFEQLKGLLADIFAGLTEETPEGFLAPDPGAVRTVEGISKALTTALEQARLLGERLDFSVLIPITEALGAILQGVALILSAAIEGFVRGLSTAAQILQAILAPFKALFTDTKEWGIALRSIAVLLVQILTTYYALVGVQALLILGFKGWVLLVTTVKSLFIGLRAAVLGLKAVFVTLVTVTKTWAAITKLASAPLLIVLAAIVAILAAAQKLLEVFGDIEFGLGTILKIVKNSLVAAFRIAWINIKIAGAKVLNFFKDRILDLQAAWIEASKTGSGFFAALGQGLGIEGAKELNEQLALERVQALEAIEDQRAANDAMLQTDLKRLDNLEEMVKLQRDLKNGQAVLQDEAGEGGLAGFFTETFDEISELLGGIFDITAGFGGAEDEALSLLEVLERMPGVLAQSRIELARQAELMDEIGDEAQDAMKDVARFIVSGGADSNIEQIRVTLLDAIFAEGEKAENLRTELTKLQQKQNGLLSQQLRLEKEVADLTAEQRFEYEKGLAISNSLLGTQKERAAAEKEIVLARGELARAREIGDEGSIKKAQDDIRAQQIILRTLNAQLALEKKIAEQIGEGLGEEGRAGVLEAIKAQILLEGNLLVTDEQIKAVLEDQVLLHDQINKAVKNRIRLLASQQLARLEQEIPRIQTEQAALQRLRPFVGALATDAAGERRAQAENEVAESRLRLREAELQATRDLAVLSDSIDEARQRGIDGQKDLLALTELRTTKMREQAAVAGILNDDLSVSVQLLQEAVRAQEEGLQFGIEVGFAEFARTALDSFEAARNFMQTALENFSSLISQTIADAFDPTTNTDIRERFGQFLKSLSEMIINYLTQLAIAKLVQSLIGGSNQDQAGATMLAAAIAWTPVTIALQAAADTLLTAAIIQASASSAGGFGFASGGEIPNVHGKGARPKGLHPSDTVPIWAAPGEYMVKAKAVGKYGSDVMQAINRGLIDPTSLRALTGVNQSRRVRSSRGPGFADGGLVSSSVQSLADSEGEGSGATVAMVVADDQAAERILTGGKNAVFEFFRENNETFRAILRG
ncbi:MAG: hypothetical protein GY906_13000 [bacterium]|nr:hypothetical protein [bacterium]